MCPDTIAAIATPLGSGGIGIIKISGPEAISIVGTLFRKKGPRRPHTCNQLRPSVPDDHLTGLKSHRLYYGHMVDPSEREVLDEVLVAVMRGPNSYTREDVVEIQAHSGNVSLNAILERVLKQGARLAEPGEFTKRAFLNGRIDLTQAEAVIDIINAKTTQAVKQAVEQSDGRLAHRIRSDRQTLMDILVELEANIDFPDELKDDAPFDIQQLIESLTEVREHTMDLIDSFQAAAIIRNGLQIAIAGRTNVGKSSLLNCLLQKERAIVTEIPGTTRDLIEDQFQISGAPFIITDTAGLQETDDPVEKLGIGRTQQAIDAVDLVLIVVEADIGFTRIDEMILNRCRQKAVVVVVNKDDLTSALDPSELMKTLPNPHPPLCRVSAKYQAGIEALKRTIMQESRRHYQLDEKTPGPAINLRHKTALESCLASLTDAIEGFRSEKPDELIAMDLKEAAGRLDEITGKGSPEELLDRIFGRFCIGK